MCYETCHNCVSYGNDAVVCDECIFGVVDKLRKFVEQQREVADAWRKKGNNFGNDRSREITAHCDGVMKAVVAIEALLPVRPTTASTGAPKPATNREAQHLST